MNQGNRVESSRIWQLIFNKNAKEIPCRKDSFSSNVSAIIGYLLIKTNKFILYTKINSKFIIGLNVKIFNIRLL